MVKRKRNQWGRAVLVSVASSFAMMTAVSPVPAQTAATPEGVREVDLSHQPLGDALVAARSSSGAFIVTQRAAAGSGPSPSDAMAAGKPRVIDTIVVSGTKKGLTVQETNVSVAIFDAGAIKDRVLFDVEDILLRTPNVSTNGSGELNGLSIRGVALSGVGGAGTGTTSNVYVDGSPNSGNANQGAANLWDVAQVEILRGPQSTVQGRNALSGAVIIQTADPEYDVGADLRALVGNQEQRNGSGTITGPLLEDQIAFRLAVDYREIDFGDVTFDGGGQLRLEFNEVVRAIADIRYDVTDNWTGALRLRRFERLDRGLLFQSGRVRQSRLWFQAG